MIYAVCVGAVHSYGLLDGYYFLPFLPHVLGARGRESHDGHRWPARKEVNACRLFGTWKVYLSMEHGLVNSTFEVGTLLIKPTETLLEFAYCTSRRTVFTMVRPLRGVTVTVTLHIPLFTPRTDAPLSLQNLVDAEFNLSVNFEFLGIFKPAYRAIDFAAADFLVDR